MSLTRIKLFDLRDAKIRTLHLSWFAFFLTFAIWFSHAPLKPLIMEAFNMTSDQWKTLLILNVALTIPARIIIGMLVDRFGPRLVYSSLLVVSGVLCCAFAFAQTYEQMALLRFLLGFVGAGFVIGIRMVGEWFPAKSVGLAQGIYAGWGNFGGAAAAFTLPTIALTIYGGGKRMALRHCIDRCTDFRLWPCICLACPQYSHGLHILQSKENRRPGSDQRKGLLALCDDEYSHVPSSLSAGLESFTPRDKPYLTTCSLPAVWTICGSVYFPVFANI